MNIRHASDNVGHQLLAGTDQHIQPDGNLHHPRKTAVELGAHVPAHWRQNPLDGPVMTDQIDDEGGAKPIVDPFVRQQTMDVEKVARMLAIKRCHQLAGKEVRE